MNQFVVYILYSQKLNKYYCGSTGDLEKRLYSHNHAQNKYTKKGIPWQLVYHQPFETVTEARQQEQKIKKRGIGRYLSDLSN